MDTITLVAEADIRGVVHTHYRVACFIDECELTLRRVGRGDILYISVCEVIDWERVSQQSSQV